MFIDTYIAERTIMPAIPAARSAVAGEVPQRPAAFQPRAGLLEDLRENGPGVSVVRAVTGMRGVGKTQPAAAYARSCIDAGWRLVAWVNAEDTAKLLNGLAVVAVRLGIGAPDEALEAIAAAVRNWLEEDGEQCLVVFDNVTDLDGLRPVLPAAGKAQVVITSTGQAAADLGAVVPVSIMNKVVTQTLAATTGSATEPLYLHSQLRDALRIVDRQVSDHITRARLGKAVRNLTQTPRS